MITNEIRKTIILNLLGNPDFVEKAIEGTDEYFEFQIRARTVLECLLNVQQVEGITIADPDSEIAIIWSIEDIQGERPHLSDEQAREVLQMVKRKHDANIGVNWEVLKYWADELFPVE